MPLTKKQKQVLDYIVSYTHQNGVSPTQREIRDHFGLKSFGSVQRYLKYLADAGHISQDWNARRGLKIEEPMPNRQPPAASSSEHVDIPLLGDVAAGDPIEALEDAHHQESVTVPKQMLRPGKRFFALQVHGESMIEEGILPDDLIVCQKQESAQQGEKIVAVINGEATVKKFYQHDNRIELHPANSKLSPFIYSLEDTDDDDEFRIAGKVVGLLRFYGT